MNTAPNYVVKINKANFDKPQSVLKPPMNLRIFLQRSEYSVEKDEYCRNKTKISLPSQYSMSFSGKHYKVVYILVSIKLHVGQYMDSVHYICDLLDYNTGTWWNCDNYTINNYSGYPENFYDNLSN